MLFNSYEFLFAFFPAAIAAYHLLGRGQDGRAAVLLVASLVFYASWDWRFLALLVASILANYALGIQLRRSMQAGRHGFADAILAAGVTLNLLVLGVFKYAGFVVANLNALAGTDLVLARIILPLGISFFTFEQVGFLIDLRRGHAYRLNLLRYAVFVTFFPRLVAGPILRYGEIVPQLEGTGRATGLAADLAVGLSIFAIGLAKKALLADGISPFVATHFNAADGQQLDLFMAWGGALAYTCQLYFDFSGYSDMAIGAARCFGIRFPQNFNSPYKSASIVEFWRRWHMTLSRFLRDYLYISLGGNRRGKVRRYVNLLVTMMLGGLWHGANWTFLAWGALHGTPRLAASGPSRRFAPRAPAACLATSSPSSRWLSPGCSSALPAFTPAGPCSAAWPGGAASKSQRPSPITCNRSRRSSPRGVFASAAPGLSSSTPGFGS